jgi:hypothetical protein
MSEKIELEEVESIMVNCKVRVFAKEGMATVSLPPELRITEVLAAYLHTALKQRDLELTQWNINTPEQRTELENLPNVIMGQEQN